MCAVCRMVTAFAWVHDVDVTVHEDVKPPWVDLAVEHSYPEGVLQPEFVARYFDAPEIVVRLVTVSPDTPYREVPHNGR